MDTTDAKIVTRDGAVHALQAWHGDGATVVLTNGVFDLVHVGHVRYLQEARSLGDVLVVGLNDDASVRALKGPERPFVPLEERAVVLAALECVGLVVPFAERTAEALVSALRPDIYVKGGDYDPAAGPGERGHLPEARVVSAYGGRVAVLSFTPDRSTTALVRRIRGEHASWPRAGLYHP